MRSHLTLLVYLSDGAAFTGGDTVFYAQGPVGQGNDAAPGELGRVRPRAGSLLLFDHDIWHAGDEVTAGTKHVLRSDVLYRAAATDGPSESAAEHQGYVWNLAALGDGCTASGGRDATIRIRDAAGDAVRALRGHAQSVLGLAPLPGKRLASVSRDRSLRIWHWPTGVCETIVTAHDSAILDVIALPGGRLATSAADGLIKLWHPDVSTAGSLAGHDGWVWQLAARVDGTIASASEDGAVRIWDTASLRCTAILPDGQPLRTLLALEEAICTGDIAGRITRWSRDVDGWRCSAQFQAHRAAIRRLRHLGGGLVASCGEDCVLRVWDSRSCAKVFEARHGNFVTDALRHGDALLGSSYDGRILCHQGCPMPAGGEGVLS